MPEFGLRRLIVRKKGVDVSDDIETANGKANPFGWSVCDLIHKERINGQVLDINIGTLYCGEPKITDPEYAAEIVDA